MAKKQTRRSISVSRTTYERLKAFCETNNISMSQFVETRVGDFLGEGSSATVTIPAPARPSPSRPTPTTATIPAKSETRAPTTPVASAQASQAQPVPMTSAAARYAVEPPPPIIKRTGEQAAPKPAEKRPDQIFTF